MATDGGQIRTVDNVLAEQNHSQTCTAINIMTTDKLIIGTGLRTFGVDISTTKGIIYIDGNGNTNFLPVPDGEAGYNKILATDINSNLYWKDQA